MLGYVALVGEQRDILCGVRARFNDPDISVHRLESFRHLSGGANFLQTGESLVDV
jgi:hypothetical protein